MTLTSGRGPLSRDRAGRFIPPIPDDVVYVEPYPRRLRGIVDGRAVIDTERAHLLHRAGDPPIYVFPAADAAAVASTPTDVVAGHVTVAWGAVDEWWEEGQQVFVHPKNPYHRVDCVPARRRLRVEVAGEVLVDTDEVIAVFETALAPRLYVAKRHVRMDLLTPTSTETWCAYKGVASYWTATVADTVVDDVAWSYESPLADSGPIAGMVSFYGDRATVDATLPASG